MSFRVVSKVLRHSEETLARRLILIVLAEVAHDDGVVFLGQDELARRARLSRPHVAERLREMDAEGVIETRKAQRGRKRIAVYRLVSVPGLDPVDYDRLPFELDQPFATTSELLTRSDGDGVRSSDLTVSDPPTLDLSIGVEPSVEPPGDPSGRKGRAARLRVTQSWLRFAPPLIVHPQRALDSEKFERAINGAVHTYGVDDVVQAVESYAAVLAGDEYVWSYRWTLPDFLRRGLDRFVPAADPLSNIPRRHGVTSADFSDLKGGGF